MVATRFTISSAFALTATNNTLTFTNLQVSNGGGYQVVAVNSAFGRAFHFYFVELFLQPTAVSGRKLHSAKEDSGKGKVRLVHFDAG